MAKWQERAELLFKTEGLNNLKNANVLVVGLGGVGSFAAEFLARAGVGKMTIVDGDVVDITNVNRQLPALHSTVGMPKVHVVGDRLMDINPELNLTRLEEFLSPERALEIVTPEFDYVLDCIDSITPKLNLLISAKRKKVKAISSMGAGGKYEAAKVKVRDISRTEYCPLAKNVRKRLKDAKITKGIKAVFSTEMPDETSVKLTDGKNYKKSFYGTNSWMPCLFGLHAAETVIKYLLKKKNTKPQTVMANEQPVIKIIPSLWDKITEAIIIVILIAFWVYAVLHYQSLPEVIPTHFGGGGKPDGYGNKWLIMTLPMVVTVFYIGLSILGRYPHKFNYPGTLNEQNAATQYRIATEMLRGMKGAIIILFFVMHYQTVQTALGKADGMGNGGILLDFALLFVPLFYFLIKMSKNA